MHSSFKSKPKYKTQHRFNPYSRSMPSRPTPFQRSAKCIAQEFVNPTSHPQFGHGSLPPPLLNSCKMVTHDEQTVDTLPLKLVFSKVVDKSTRKMEYTVGPYTYFRRESPSWTEIPKKRLPLTNLLQRNSVEPKFSSDNFQTFRSISHLYKNMDDKENDVEVGAYEKLEFTPAQKGIPSNVQHRTKHMFDFGPETQIEVRCHNNNNISGRQQQNVPQLMTSADFLNTPFSYRSSRPVASNISSPHLSLFENDEIIFRTSNLSPNSTAAMPASGSSYNKFVTAFEMFSLNDTTASPSPPPRSPDFNMLSTNSPLADLGGSEYILSGNYNGSGSDFDRNHQGSGQNYGDGCEQNFTNKRCDQECSGFNSDITHNYDGSNNYNHQQQQRIVDQRCNQVGSGNSVNSTWDYNGSNNYNNQPTTVNRKYKQEGSVNSVNSTWNYNDSNNYNNQSTIVNRKYKQEGSGNSVNSTWNYNDSNNYNNQPTIVNRKYKQEGSGNSVNSTWNYNDSNNYNNQPTIVNQRYKQEGSGNSVNSTLNYNDSNNYNNQPTIVNQRYKQEGSVNSFQSTQNYNGGVVDYNNRQCNIVDQRCNQGGSGNFRNMARNNDSIEQNHIDRRCNQGSFGIDPVGSLCNDYYNISDNLSVHDFNDNDSGRCSVSSETVIPRHMIDLWLSESPSSSNFDGRQGVNVSGENIDDDIVSTVDIKPQELAFHNHCGINEVERSVDCAKTTLRKVRIRKPMLSYPDEE